MTNVKIVDVGNLTTTNFDEEDLRNPYFLNLIEEYKTFESLAIK